MRFVDRRIGRILISLGMFSYDAIWIFTLFFYIIPVIKTSYEWHQWIYDPEGLIIFFLTVGFGLTVYTFVWGMFLLFDR